MTNKQLNQHVEMLVEQSFTVFNELYLKVDSIIDTINLSQSNADKLDLGYMMNELIKIRSKVSFAADNLKSKYKIELKNGRQTED